MKYVLLLIATLFAQPLLAQQSVSWGWGNAEYGTAPSTLTVAHAKTHYADVVFNNKLTQVINHNNFEDHLLIIDGLSVQIHINFGDGVVPDVMTAIPPPGYIAIPDVLTVPDNSVGIIELHEFIGS